MNHFCMACYMTRVFQKLGDGSSWVALNTVLDRINHLRFLGCTSKLELEVIKG